MTIEPDIRALEEHYSRLAREHGDSPRAAQWSSVETQEARMAVLAEIGDLRTAKVLDFGCGTGHLLSVLRGRGFAGEYVGYDLSAEMIAIARKKYPDARFEARDVLAAGMPERFDYVLASGVFNNGFADGWKLLTTLLPVLHAACDRGLAFNALSTYVDFFDDGLYYADPERVFRFCKEHLSPLVVLRHDYQVKPEAPPFEFTVYVRRTEVGCRPHRPAR
jgi:SAM-dependent methyltransferase